MDIVIALELVRRLRAVQWSWDLAETEAVFSNWGLGLHERIPGRTSYDFSEDIDCSVYYSGKSVRFMECTLLVFMNPEELSASAYKDKEKEFISNYDNMVMVISKDLGPPSFEGPFGKAGFPKGQDAIRLALWRVTNGYLMLEFKHEDKELPMRLCIDIYPSLT